MFSFFETRTARIVIDTLAIVGVIAGFYHIWEAIFAEGKGLTASYKTVIVADGSDLFQINSFVRQDIEQASRIVDLGVILWNSGGQIISNGDIRGDEHALTVELQLDNSSYLIDNGWKLGKQNASTQNNFAFRPQAKNSFSLTWQLMDPGDYFEVHFLIATKLDRSQVANIGAKINGSVTGTKGNVAVKIRPFNSIQEARRSVVPLAILGFPLAFLLIVVSLPDTPPALMQTWKRTSRIAVFLAIFIFGLALWTAAWSVTVAGVIHYFTFVPEWTNFSLVSFLRTFRSLPL